MRKRIALFLTCMLMSGLALAQTMKVTGTVISVEDGEPIPGASVLIEGTKTGVVTNADGQFTLAVPADAKRLEVSCAGMVKQLVRVKPVVNVELQTDSKALDEVMVVAYGTATRASFTGSAAVIDSKDIEGRLVSDVTNALSGAVAGVQTLKSNGQPGTGSTVRIRGIGSMAASNGPLYVVDQVPYDGDISAINPQDIEQLTVLKDAAAAALYGARGANGVIMITTKKGKRGEAQVTVEGRWGSNSRGVKNYNVLKNTAQYYETMYNARYNEGRFNLGYNDARAYQYANSGLATLTGYQIYNIPTGQYLIGRNGKLNPNATLGYSDGQYYYTPDDWEDESFHNGLRQEYVASVSGGTDKLDYYLSAGYLSDEGVIVGSGFDRISTRLNVNYQAKSWLKFGTNVAYTNSKSNYPSDQGTDDTNTSSGNVFYTANNMAPVYPFYVRDATGAVMRNGKNPVYDYGDGSSTNFTRNFMAIANPIGDLKYQSEQYLMDILSGKLYATITPVKGLNITGRWGLDVDNTRYNYASSSLYGQSASYGGQAVQEHMRTYGLNQQYLANYARTFKDVHNLDLLAGYESYDYQYEWSEAVGQNLYKEGDWTVNNTIDQRRGYGAKTAYATKGILARANYNFNEQYFGSVSYRRDGSSRFHPDNRWGNFWSASAAWELAKEKWLQNAKWIDMLKIKASFGQQGNDGLGNNYAYIDQYTVTGSNGVFSDGTLAYKGNPEISWEKSNAFNAGVDFNFWHGRLSGSVEYFNRTTKDMLYNKPVSPSEGYSSIPMNVGDMRNQGVEIELSSNIIETSDFSWNLSVNGTYLQNKVLKLHPDLNGELIDGSRIYREGESVYQLYLTHYAGVFDDGTGYANPNNGLALYEAKNPYTNHFNEDGSVVTDPVSGNAINYDANGDPVMASNGTDYVFVTDVNGNVIGAGQTYLTTNASTAYSTNRKSTGNIMPKFYGGLSTEFKFKGFDLSVQCAYQLGGKILDQNYRSLMHGLDAYSVGTAWHKDVLNAWTPQNTNTDIPRIAAENDLYTNYQSDRWMTKSNYFAINNITLGYTLPRTLTKKAHIESIRLYGAADNVFIFSARKGFDPRISYTATQQGSYYTALRTITFGIKATF